MLTREQCESYQRNGYLLVPDLFSKAQLAPALEVAEQNAYGKSHEEFNAEIDAHPEIAETLIRPKGRRSFGGPRAQFHDIPTGIDAIDRTLEHEPFLDALSQLLDTPDMHYHHGFVYARSGRLDRGTPKRTLAGLPHRLGKTPAPPAPGMATLRPHPGLGLSDRQRRRLRPGPRIARRTQQNEQTHPRPTRHRTRIVSL